MKVKIHKLFELFLNGTAANPEASVLHSLAASPRLGDFIDDLDPDLCLDWSGQSFLGMPSLREKVISRLAYDKGCSIDDVLITAGTAEANFLAITQLLEAGDEIIVDVPGWPQPLVLAEALGANIKKLVRKEEKDWAFDIEELRSLVTNKTKLIFICNPNNPTGHLLEESLLNEVVNLADTVGAYVLTDEVYSGLEWVERKTPRVANLYERGISTGSVSKVLGLQGLRLGWLVCRDTQLIHDAMILREDTSEIMNIMGEAIADIALRKERYDAAISKARKDGEYNLNVLDQFISQQKSLSWCRPQAGLIGFCRLDLPCEADDFAEKLLSSPYRTFVIPGSAYGYPHHLRLGVGGGQAAELDKGLANLDKLLTEYS